MKLFVLLPALLCFFELSVSFSYAGSATDDLDAILKGFDAPADETPVPAPVGPGDESESAFSISGTFSELFSHNLHNHVTPAGYEVKGVRNVKSRLDIDGDLFISEKVRGRFSSWMSYDLIYTLADYDDRFSSEIVDEQEKELELGEMYLTLGLSPEVDFTFGRQVLIWGKADMFRVNDIWNPIDNREPDLVRGGGSRLPLLMSRLDYYHHDWHLTAALSHEYRHAKTPVFGSDCYPYEFRPAPFEDSGRGLERSSYGVAATCRLTGTDIGGYLGSFLQDYDQVGLTSETLYQKVSRVQMLGAAMEMAQGHWLFKFESSLVHGLEYYSLPGETKDRFDLLIGSEYSGLQDSRITLEIVNRYLFDYSSEIASRDDTPRKDTLIWALRYSRNFLRDRLNLELVAYAGGVDFSKGAAEKISFHYALTDAWQFSSGLFLLQSGDTYLTRNIGKNDVFFMSLKYFF